MENELFPGVLKIEIPKKPKKPRRKSTLYSKKENNRRYKLHRKVKKIESISLFVRERLIELPIGFEINDYRYVKELIEIFKYQASTLFK